MRYVCEDCCSIFKVFTHLKDKDNKKYYCPTCGYNHSIRIYKKTDKSNAVYTYIHWKAQEEKKVKQWMGDGVTVNEMALRLGRSYSSVKNKVREIRLRETCK